jgi:hypothetical protein
MAEGTKQCVTVVDQDCPPFEVVYVLPESQPEVTGAFEPPATQLVGDAQVTVVSAFWPRDAADHAVPLSEVMSTLLPPTATQDVADVQAIAASDATPAGTLCCAQVEPPSEETSTMPVLKVVCPTA